MANSGIQWIDYTFDACVKLLYQLAALMNITYEEINVWLFVIVLPVVLCVSMVCNFYFLQKLRASRELVAISPKLRLDSEDKTQIN